MKNKYYEQDVSSADQARFAAQKIAFGPLVFHAALALRDLGVLSKLMQASPHGADKEALCQALSLSSYAVTVLLESGLGAQLVYIDQRRYHLTKTGYFMLHDEMTRVNMNFVRDVCYAGAGELIASLKEGRPAGLQEIAEGKLIYDQLDQLPEPAKTSWFEFDHFYSDSAFKDALPHVFENQPTRLMDIGCNTGKFAKHCAAYREDVQLTLVDSTAIVEKARANLSASSSLERVTSFATDLLDHAVVLPGGQDAVWMSQLLSCFSEQDVVLLLRRGAAALNATGELFILETFWDQQPHAGGAFSLLQTSLYFTTMANGTSRVYDLQTLVQCAQEAGLEVTETHHRLGLSHSLLRCRPRHARASSQLQR